MQNIAKRQTSSFSSTGSSEDPKHSKSKFRAGRQSRGVPFTKSHVIPRDIRGNIQSSSKRKRKAVQPMCSESYINFMIIAVLIIILGIIYSNFLNDESIPYVLNDDNHVYYISLSKLKPYPNSLLYQLYLERKNSSSMGPIFIDRSSQSFRYISDYLCNRKISIAKFNYYNRLQLYSDFLYYHITPPNSLIQLDIEREKMSRWNEKIITLLVNRKLYSINKDNLKKRMMLYTLFNRPLSRKIRFNYEFNSLEVADPIRYFDYIDIYIKEGVFYLNKTDQNSVTQIRNEFEYFNILFTEKLWKNIVHFDSHFYGSTLISDKHASFLSSWLGTQHYWKLIYKGSRDGFRLFSYHKKCDNKGPTLSLISSRHPETAENYLMGFYLNVPIISPPDEGLYKVIDPEAFLFTLKNAHNISPTRYPCYIGNRTILFSAYKGPIISTCNRSDLHSFFCNDRFNETKACWSYIEKWDSDLIPSNIGSSLFFNTDNPENVNAFAMEEMEVFMKI